MIRFICPSDRPQGVVPWHWSTDPYPALRGAGSDYSVTLPAARALKAPDPLPEGPDWEWNQSSGFVWSRSKPLLVPKWHSDDERLLMITVCVEGRIDTVGATGAEILVRRGGYTHHYETAHLVCRLLHADGYIQVDSWKRGRHYCEIFNQDGCQTLDEAPKTSGQEEAEVAHV